MPDTPDLGSQCEICGNSNPDVLEKHHKLPQRLGGSDAGENLVTLCGSCHNAVERIYTDEFYSRLFDTVGYEVEETGADEFGIEVDDYLSPDREFPPEPVHVTVEEVGANELKRYVEAGVFDWEDLEEEGILERMSVEEWEEAKRQFDREKHGEVRSETEEEIEKWAGNTPKFRSYDGVNVIHCGYCNTVFRKHEAAKAAKHLQVVHRVEDPYLRESDNVSDWEKRKRVLKVKDGWKESSSIINSAGLDGGYNDDVRREQNESGVNGERNEF